MRFGLKVGRNSQCENIKNQAHPIVGRGDDSRQVSASKRGENNCIFISSLLAFWNSFFASKAGLVRCEC